MSDNTSAISRRRASRALIALFGVGGPLVGVGITLFSAAPSPTPTAQIPCVGEVCTACLAPSVAQCVKLTQCGGEPCPEDVGGVDPYAGPTGQLARGLRRAGERGALMTWHTDVVTVAAGVVTDCATVVYLDRDQRAAWRRTVDADGLGSVVVDCRFGSTAAKFKRNGVRRSILAGMPADGTDEAEPEDSVTSIDAGPE